MSVIFAAYLVVGLAMPVLPLHVHNGLGFGAFMVGIVTGAQFAAALGTRIWAGHSADARGSKRAVITGILAMAAAGLVYLVSLRFADPAVAVSALIAARLLLGLGQGFIVAGGIAWGIMITGPQHTGKVLAWLGIALYGAHAFGAPVGAALFEAYGFASIALATLVLPLLTLALVAPMQAMPARPQHRADFRAVLGAILKPGIALALGVSGYGAVLTFVVLLYLERGWDQAWLAFTVLSLAFMAGRAFFGHLPDKIGGAPVAACFALVETAGLALIYIAPTPAIALTGVSLTGLGYALVYPSFGVEALRRAPPENRGLATGAFTSFYDLSLGIGGPAFGLLASFYGTDSIFAVSAVIVAMSAAMAVRMMGR